MYINRKKDLIELNKNTGYGPLYPHKIETQAYS